MPAHLEQRLDALAANRFPACLAAICLFTALVVGYGATLPYFYGIDEPKYAACALEMASTGNWAAPMVDGLPRIEKPPLTYWAMLPFIGAARAMGGDAWVTPFTCRLAGVLCAALAVAAAGLIGRRTAGERAGLAAGLVLASSTLFAFKAMIMKVDVVFTCLMAWSAYALLLRFIGDRPGRSGAWATAFMALGALAKGPFAVAPLFAYALAGLIRAGFAGPERGPRRAWAWLVREIPFFLAAGLIPAASVLAWLGWAYLVSGVDYLAGFMSQYEANTAPSVAQGAGRPTTWGFYLLYVPFIYFFPWGAFVPGGLIRPGPCRKDARGGTLFLVCFMLAFLALCVFLYRMRSSRYLLPAFPVLAVMVGRFLAASPADRYKRLLLGLALALFAGVLAFFVFRYQASTQVWDSFPHPTINHGMWMLGAALVVYAAGFAAATLFQPSRPLAHVLAAALLFALVLPPYFATQPSEAHPGRARMMPVLSLAVARELAKELEGGPAGDTVVLRSDKFGDVNPDINFFQKDLPAPGGAFYMLSLPFSPRLFLGLLANPGGLAQYLETREADLAGLPMYERFTGRTFKRAVVVLAAWEMPVFEAYWRQLPPTAKPALKVTPVSGMTVKWTKARAYVAAPAR